MKVLEFFNSQNLKTIMLKLFWMSTLANKLNESRKAKIIFVNEPFKPSVYSKVFDESFKKINLDLTILGKFIRGDLILGNAEKVMDREICTSSNTANCIVLTNNDGKIPASVIPANVDLSVVLTDESIEERHLKTGAVSNRVLADNSVSTSKIQNNAVTRDKIQDGAINNQKISVTAQKINNLNADLLDGYNASLTPTPNSIPVADSNGKLDPGWLPPISGGAVWSSHNW